MKTIVILGSSSESCHIIRRARDLGLRTVVVDANPEAPGFQIADRVAIASCYHAEPAIRELERIGKHYDGVLCACVDAPYVAAAVAERFGLPGLTPERAKLSMDKMEQKKVLRKQSIPVPDFGRMDKSFIHENGLSIYCDPGNKAIGWWDFEFDENVVKPQDSRGGRGVIRLRKNVEKGDVFIAYEQAKSQSPTGRVMVEEWLDGPQLNSESIIQDGRILFTALSWRNYARLDEFAPHVIEDGLDIIQHNTELYLRVNTVLTGAINALGWDRPMTVKGDLVIHKGQVHVIELAARLSGGHYATHTIPLAYGVPFVDCAIKFSLGEQAGAIAVSSDNYVSQRYVFPAPDDIGKTVVSVKALDGLVDYASWYIKPGDVIQPVRSHPDRWGQTICMGRTESKATALAEWNIAEMKKGVVLE